MNVKVKKLLLIPLLLFGIFIISTSILLTTCFWHPPQRLDFPISLNDTYNQYDNNPIFSKKEVEDYSIYSFKGTPKFAYKINLSTKNIIEGYIVFYKNKLCCFTLYFDSPKMNIFKKDLLKIPNVSWHVDKTNIHKGPLTTISMSDKTGNRALIGQEAFGFSIQGSFSMYHHCGGNQNAHLNLKPPFRYQGV